MTDTAPPIRDAATVLLIRRDQGAPSVLMGMRGAKAVFMPSKYVFPGGAVDAEDTALPLARPLAAPHHNRLLAEPRDNAPTNPAALAGAALRELAEETGLLLGRPGAGCALPGFGPAGLIPDAGALHFVFRAITPPGRPRRFDARFFLADATDVAGDPEDFSAACDELSHLHWVPLAQARALNLPFITEVVLAEVAELIHSADHGPLPIPDSVPFFDNRSTNPRFAQIT
ncbi:MAG: NUDIX hydrolase [Paracoccus sp. (in: a-proteobacteria)]|uniref:NUDIX hydrolase n=1 Tax=Paracoccus sp. TaxID=267 RepID=UPI0026E013B3|nr:NUDIX hydrolase [Paracoccus sp. (in: a-proteobacteria)]MDO5630477.1 NUDIX hydrolase [Paracoccus sp. (in: a-proteobacteria)]